MWTSQDGLRRTVLFVEDPRPTCRRTHWQCHLNLSLHLRPQQMALRRNRSGGLGSPQVREASEVQEPHHRWQTLLSKLHRASIPLSPHPGFKEQRSAQGDLHRRFRGRHRRCRQHLRQSSQRHWPQLHGKPEACLSHLPQPAHQAPCTAAWVRQAERPLVLGRHSRRALAPVSAHVATSR